VGATGRPPVPRRPAVREPAASRPATPLSELVAELADQRLDLLDGGGDPRAAVRAVLSWSVCHLPAYAARVLRLLGLHPGQHADAFAAAALAGDQLRRALTAFRQVGDPSGTAWALKILGDVEARLGDLEAAIEHHREALAIDRQLGNRAGEAWALTNIGSVHLRAGRPDHATRHQREALGMFRLAGERYGEATALNGLGEAASAAGHAEQALAYHAAAQTAAADCGGRDEEARAHAGLARAYRALADEAEADEHLRRALDLYAELGSPEAEQLRAWQTASGQPTRHAAGNRLAGHRRPTPSGGTPTSWAGR
jgi:tetratricopeptide (TPR) repeat protein